MRSICNNDSPNNNRLGKSLSTAFLILFMPIRFRPSPVKIIAAQKDAFLWGGGKYW
jgi:hypothetical protein